MLKLTRIGQRATLLPRATVTNCLGLTSSPQHAVHNSTESNSSSSNDMRPLATASVPTTGGGGFAKAMAKMEGHENFPRSLRFSSLVQMGEPLGKFAEGTIVHVVDNDLYIDFGAKFNCVCPRPQKNGSAYLLGKKVRVVIHDLELSTRFLGAKSDLTILEADCSLLGLATSYKDASTT